MPSARRGEVWLVDLGIVAKVRPVLILSTSFTDEERALYLIVPHTTALRGGRFEVILKVPGLDEGAFDVQGMRPIAPPALLRKLSQLSPLQLKEVERAVKRWLEIS
ncbi:MAG TPA: type II toxin-antitoxin system PemK/MazF family toxin [Verrucomicrobiae bacterium]